VSRRRVTTALSWGRRFSCGALLCDPVGTLLDLRVSSRLAVPRWLRSGSFSLGVDPLQSRHVLPAVRRFTAGAGSHEVFRPYDDVIQASPVLRWSIHLHRGSAPRFSQPLSGFWHTWSSRPCFVPLPSMGFTLQSVPPRRGRCPSRDRQLPCSSPPPYLRCDTPGRILRVSPTPAPSRGGLDPPGAPTPFPPLASQRLPRRLEPCAPCSPRSGDFGCFEALLPPRGRCSRHDGLPSRRGSLLSWVLPLQSLSPVEPRALR